MIDAARELDANANIIAVEEVPAERVHMYGVVGVGERKGSLFALTQMVEKPAREAAPSNLIITGRYILQPEIFDILAAEKRGAGDEIQLTDAMIELAKTPAVLRPEIRRQQLRLRLEGGLSRRQRRLRARAQRHRAGGAGGDRAPPGRPLTRRNARPCAHRADAQG